MAGLYRNPELTAIKPIPATRQPIDELVTLAWPLFPEDCQQLTNQPRVITLASSGFQQRLIRPIEYGWNHPDGPKFLTVADLVAMLGLTTVQVSLWLKQARQTTARLAHQGLLL
ncbi:MAG: hypothetical protein U0401_27000 [Anaerolineae bacterium]